ncbi:CRISPR-associated protein Csb1 [Prauserella aidingensis]|uniref:type I-G CRISPR-associated RAMP protein Csb1/Cas7g n=1 Tax=Prauserella aidingensis TaxID=387890 RepID=UPI0020A3C1ED|nr:type I-U CRISPR-associated RAMP protein Csb1/Cas7u [Prauserella aidingensis]MCP2255206.1 CRISPR-associated protein Csb1 [Prauserella aidingensis]
METLKLDDLLSAVEVGGANCLRSVTELEPAAGPHASVAPAKFASARSDMGTYAYETRYDEDGNPSDVVIIDSKQSQLNRVEHALAEAIRDGHPVLSRLPRLVVEYERNGETVELSDLELPHRAFDGHVRAGSVDGSPAPTYEQYRAIRDASPANARALFDTSPASLVFGSWDSTRAARQGRWRSLLAGEIIGYCRKPANSNEPERKGGARVDPMGMRIELSGPELKALAERQRVELSGKTFETLTKAAAAAKGDKRAKTSNAGLGGIPPSLEALAGVACRRIVRSHVLSFAALRQIRFGAGPEGDAACRALLVSLALSGLARSDAELVLRANCDLVETSPTRMEMLGRGGTTTEFAAPGIEAADALLASALDHAESVAGVSWNGVVLRVAGDPAIAAGAADDDAEGN